MALRIAIDRERCMGSGTCEFWAPAVFHVADDGIAVVLDPSGASVDTISSAASGCPTGAISVSEE
jgi:ferredoxin